VNTEWARCCRMLTNRKLTEKLQICNTRLGALDDRQPDRMLGKLFDTCDERQRFIFCNALGNEVSQRGMAERQRPRLVHHQSVDVAQPLDRLGVAEQDAGARALPHGDGHRDRCGEADRHTDRR
jgi:hypothetical protein